MSANRKLNYVYSSNVYQFVTFMFVVVVAAAAAAVAYCWPILGCVFKCVSVDALTRSC